MATIKVTLEFDEKKLGEEWMNPDNLEILLYTDTYTNRDSLKIVAYQEIKLDPNSSQLEAQVSEILADFENLLIEIMSNRKCSIGSIDNYYDLHLEVKKINELYSKLQYYHIVSQKSR